MMKSIEQKVYEKLKEKNMKIATAESCTGGLVAGRLINVSGASEILDYSVVTYANEFKVSELGVNEKSIEKYGVVSEVVAGEMALGVSKKADSNVGVSTSGIAGPTGGTATKPVGMVCFGISINGKVHTFTQVFKPRGRAYVRRKSVEFVLKTLLELLN